MAQNRGKVDPIGQPDGRLHGHRHDRHVRDFTDRARSVMPSSARTIKRPRASLPGATSPKQPGAFRLMVFSLPHRADRVICMPEMTRARAPLVMHLFYSSSFEAEQARSRLAANMFIRPARCPVGEQAFIWTRRRLPAVRRRPAAPGATGHLRMRHFEVIAAIVRQGVANGADREGQDPVFGTGSRYRAFHGLGAGRIPPTPHMASCIERALAFERAGQGCVDLCGRISKKYKGM